MSSMNRLKKPYSRPAPRPRGTDGEWLHDMADETRPRAPRAMSKSINGNGNTVTGTTQLMVSNLHYELNAKDLTQIFGQVGTLVKEPLIRYDRSGRSSGVAIVSLETPQEAAEAKRRYDGKLAKGQPMSIVFYQSPARNAPKRGGAPSSLLHRIEKAPLLDRLGGAQPETKTQSTKNSPGLIRTRPARPPRVPKKPKTQSELDAELDAFMSEDITPAPKPAPAAQAEGDVEMA